MNRYFFFLFLIFIFPGVYGQVPVLDSAPPSIQWNQINTPQFKVVFPEGFEHEAQRTANTLQHLYEPVSQSMGVQPRKVSVILQNQNAVSNAFVALGPRRSEFYTMPPQDYTLLGTNDWINMLSMHEFRHVVQYDKSIMGFNKFIYYVLGENALGGMANLYVPAWFWEGDAVAIETALSKSGRGRIPAFDMAFRTNLLERGAFDYDKQHLRSFKHFVPNHYVTGYHMITHLRRHYDAGIWSRIVEHAWRSPFVTFSRAMKRETGKNVTENYRGMVNELDSLWSNQIDDLNISPAKAVITDKENTFTNYEFPQLLEDGRILALRSGIGDIDQFVAINSAGNVEILHTPGIVNPTGMISLANGKIAWNEFIPDIRWGKRSYSVIKLYDLNTGDEKKLTNKSRYYSAALSPDASKIVTVQVTENNAFTIKILDVKSGDVINEFSNPENAFYTMPRWSDDGSRIVALKSTMEGKAIVLLDIKSGLEKQLTPYGQENYGSPVLYGKYLLYNSPYSGFDNIYAMNIATGQQYQVTSRKYGSFNPVVDPLNETIYFNDFSKDGMDILQMPFAPNQWKKLEEIEKSNIHYYEPLVEQEGNADVLENIAEKEYPVQKYSEWKGIINPYSWGPAIFTSGSELQLALSSRDILSTTAITAGYVYNANESSGYGFGQISYQGIFPVLDLSASVGTRTIKETINDEQKIFSWNETSARFGVRLPLLFTSSKYLEGLNFSAATAYTYVNGYDNPVFDIDQQRDGELHSLSYGFSYNRLLKRSQRDIYSRFGQTISARYEHTPLGGDYKSQLFTVQSNLLFPGLFKHHSFRLRGGYQREIIDNYRFASTLFFPRGYNYVSFDHFANAAVAYSLPLLYPDLDIGPIANVQRVRANLFYDYGYGIRDEMSHNFNSMGAEISIDYNLFRTLVLLELGVRYTYIPEFNSHSFNLLIGSFGFN